MIALDGYSVTERELGSDANHDFALVDVARGIFVVADGVGGARRSRVASSLAVRALHERLSEGAWAADPIADLRNAVGAVHDQVLEAGNENPELAGMSTTLSALVVAADRAFVVHVGDSRIYRFRDSAIERLTIDHTLVAEMLRGGHITSEMAARHPLRHRLLQAIGGQPVVDPQVAEVDLRDGDTFVLTTDGLGKVISDEQLGAYLLEAPSWTAETTCRRVFNLAAAEMPHDDLTVAVVKVLGPAAMGSIDTARGTA